MFSIAVNTARLQFKLNLKMILDRVVTKDPSAEVLSEELFERLKKDLRSDDVERSKVMGLVSEIYWAFGKGSEERKNSKFTNGLDILSMVIKQTN